MALQPDTVAGSITLTTGSASFTTSGTNMQTRQHQAGDEILLPTLGLTFVIATITGENAGTITNVCPAAANGTFTVGNWRIRFQPDNSRLAAQVRNFIVSLGSGILSLLSTVTDAIGARATLGVFGQPEIIKTSAYTAVAGDAGKTIILNKATADTLAFDAAATLGSSWMVLVKNIGAGTWTLDPNGSETIDGASTMTLLQNESCIVACNGSLLRTIDLAFRKDGTLPMTGSLDMGSQSLKKALDLNGGPLNGLRNKIINGDFDIWQRGTSFSATGYTADRVKNSRDGSGATVTISRQTHTVGQTAVPGNPKYFYRYQQTVAGSGGAGNDCDIHTIEGVGTLAGKTATLTLYAKAPAGSPTITPLLVQGFGTGGSPSADVVTSGSASSTLTGSFVKYQWVINIPSISGRTLGSNGDDGLRLQLRIPNNAVQTVDISHESLVEGDATAETDPFSPRPLQQEMALCQRYYAKSYQQIDAPGTATSTGVEGMVAANSANGEFKFVPWAVIMRGTPTVTQYGISGASGKVSDATASTEASVSSGNVSDRGYGIQYSGASPTSGHLYKWHWTADAEFA